MLEVRQLAFAYGADAARMQFDLEVAQGEVLSLIGPSGSGKSTLLSLIAGFLEPAGGSILLDGQPIDTVSLDSLRRRIGLVSQDVFLFQGTVADNIAYGSPDATPARVSAAAEAAEATEFIERLAEGYDTVVGERGQKLSGGQRQRLSIARALLKDPPVLILDEATSAVDNDTEAAIQRSLQHISHSRTTLVIAHRLSTIVGADCIHVMDQGRIVESGTHTELLDRGGIYAALWAVQTGMQVRQASAPPGS